jgi:hypothetical protein
MKKERALPPGGTLKELVGFPCATSVFSVLKIFVRRLARRY